MSSGPDSSYFHMNGGEDELVGDEHLAATLALLGYDLLLLSPEVLAGQLDEARRLDLADRLAEIERQLRSPRVP